MRNQLRLLIMLLVLTALSGLVFAQPQQQLPGNVGGQFDPSPAVGPPSVAVTEVKIVGVVGTSLRVRVKWNAQIPSTTKVEKFRTLLTVNYNSGSPASPSKEAAASAREAILEVPNRGAGNLPKSFKAFVETSFTTIVAQSEEFSGTFTLSQSNGFSATSNQNTQRPSGAHVAKVATPSLSELGKFNVSWAFRQNDQRQGLNEIRFDVTGNFSYLVGGTPAVTINRSATLTAGPGARQVQFSFLGTPKLVPGQSVNSINATINVKAIFNLTQRKESPLFEGNF